MRRLDGRTLVAGQIFPADIPALTASGVTMIVNNRPDHEEPGQPEATEIATAATAAGIGYRHMPIAGGFNGDDVLAMAEALDAADGQVLLFCRSGTRSTFLWALARAERGAKAEETIAAAAAAGYDLGPIRGWL